MGEHKIEAYLVIGHHTMIVHRQVSEDGVFNGLHAVESYSITPHAPNTYHDVHALLDDPSTECSGLMVETHDYNKARRAFIAWVMREAADELVMVDETIAS